MMTTGKTVKINDNSGNGLDHLLGEIQRIELKLKQKVSITRKDDNHADVDGFRGLYVSGKQVDAIIGSSRFGKESNLSPAGNSAPVILSEPPDKLEESIDRRKEESRRRGLTLRLKELVRLFHLSPFDVDVLLICLLTELDLEYQRVYAYLQDDVTKKSPTVDFVLQLLCHSLADRLKAREAFSREATLIKNRLVHLYEEHSPVPTPLLAKILRVDERITGYLLEKDHIDTCLLPFTHLVYPEIRLEDMVLTEDARQRLARLARQFKEKGIIFLFYGAYGVGKRATAEAICSEIGIPMLAVDVDKMMAADTSPEILVPLIFREGRLQSAALYLEGYDRILGSEREVKSGGDSLVQELENYPQLVFMGGDKAWQPKEVLYDKTLISIELPIPSYLMRKELWQKQSNGDLVLSDDVDLSDLASKFRLSGGQIRDAVAMARNLAEWRNPGNRLLTDQDLHAACRKQSREILNTLARKIQPGYHWNDIVLPKDQEEQLREICGYVKHYNTVYGDWGFDGKHSLGKGLNVLFAGTSGTGKTMAAEIIAHELGLDLYKIDLSAIVSKYIGETEKNLDRIFKDGHTSNAILFFDEADALFGKRSEVRDSHDRYANIEIAYLLQKMDEYDGVVILATNLRKNMDEAFARRMHFAVEFPLPEEPERYRIWQNIFPEEAPLAKNIDYSFLARQFRMSGGNIKNIALGAAFLAAQDGETITMKNVIRATKREYQKMGKLCTENDFACYFELVKG